MLDTHEKTKLQTLAPDFLGTFGAENCRAHRLHSVFLLEVHNVLGRMGKMVM